MLIKINDRISYIKATDEPLSADIAVIRGDTRLYLFDIGYGEAAREELTEILKEYKDREIVVILSHFHEDHTQNLPLFMPSEIYESKETFKHTKCGTIVDKPLIMSDGVELTVFPLPSSHAKGCIGLAVNDEYLFLGDGTYPTARTDTPAYNAGVLQQEIEVLKEHPAKYYLLSHKEKYIYPSAVILRQLESIYGKRRPDSPYIPLNELE